MIDPAASFPSRGQTVVALTMPEKISTIADDAELSALADQAMTDPNFDLPTALGDDLDATAGQRAGGDEGQCVEG